MLSVSGLRGIIGGSLSPMVASRFAGAVGAWLREDERINEPHVVLGRDSRPSGAMVEAAAAAGLIAMGCRVTRLGVLSTPGVAVMTEHRRADAGMVITASHNPIQWNGIKPLIRIADRVQAPAVAPFEKIAARFRESEPRFAPVDRLLPCDEDEAGVRVHVDAVLRQVDVAAIRAAKLKVVVDSVHGAAGAETAALLDALGVARVHLYAEPTGHFPHTPEPTRENLVELCQVVREQQAAIGFAQDPDADRLAVVDEAGTYIGEEYTLALCCLHLLQRSGGSAPASLVANLSTSRMLDDLASRFKAQVIRTPVGEANVAIQMQQSTALAGGEGNGGIIYPPVSLVRDSLVGIALLLEMLAQRQQTLSAIVSEIPAYAIVKDKAPIDQAVAPQLRSRLTQAYAQQTIDTQDGVRIDWPDRWIHIRPSNTEPIIRLIAEARTAEQAKSLIAESRKAIGLGSPATTSAAS